MTRRIATAYYDGNRMHVFDVFAAACSPVLALFVRDDSLLSAGTIDVLALYCVLSFVLTLVTFWYFRVGAGLTRYFSANDSIEIAKAAASAVALTSVVMFIVTRLDTIPRSVPVIHFVVLTGIVVTGRVLRRESYRRRIERSNSRPERVENLLLIGTNRLAWFYIAFLQGFGAGRHRVVGLVDDQRGAQGRSLHGYPVLGRFEAIERIVDQSALHGIAIDRVVVALEPTPDRQVLWDRLASVCGERGIKLEFLPERLGLIEDAAATPTRAPEPRPDWSPLRTGPFWVGKRTFDIVASTLVLAVSAPLFAVVAALVYWEIGTPVLFWQLRLGRDRRPLFVYKFRTLRPHYDRHGEIIPEAERLPPIGRFLRATRLDELPQLVHILKGEMSVIGPRPLLPIDQPDAESIRLAVRPGLTGWAQVHGGQLVSVDDKAALDAWYVRHASTWVDAKIIMLTLKTVVFGDKKASLRLDDALAGTEPRPATAEASKPAGPSSRLSFPL